MRFRLVPQVVAFVLTSAAVAAAAPPAGDAKKPGSPDTSDLVELGRSLLDEPAHKSSHHRHHKRSHSGAAADEAGAPAATENPAAPATAPAASPASQKPLPGTPAGTPVATPAATPAGKPVATPAGTPVGTPAATPAGTPVGTPAATPAATPAGPSAPGSVAPIPAGPAADAGPPVISDGGASTGVDAGVDAGGPADLRPPTDLAEVAASATPETDAPVHSDALPTPVKHHRVRSFASRDERVRSGQNYPLTGLMQSPLARLGIPHKAVPVVATAATVGVTAFWPFLLKTLLGLLKGLLGGYVKNWGKKNKKIDDNQRQFMVLGFRLRPSELLSLFIGAIIYGLAVCYTAKGWKLEREFVFRQEMLVLVIYYFRSFIRFAYERLFGLVTQYRFWPTGSVLCLFSAYLGNTLGTVGYDLESAKGAEAAERAVRLKMWLIIIALTLALGFFFANWLWPQKILQSGRIMTSGMALGEIMPINPLPGLKIFRWRRGVWAVLFAIIVPTFFLINFFL